MTYNIKKITKTYKDMDFNNSSRLFRPLGSRIMNDLINQIYGLSHVKNKF